MNELTELTYRLRSMFALPLPDANKRKVVVLIHSEAILEPLMAWALSVTQRGEDQLAVLCVGNQAENTVEDRVRRILELCGAHAEIVLVDAGSFVSDVQSKLREMAPTALVACGDEGDLSDELGAILRWAPCATLTILKHPERIMPPQRVLVLTHDSPSDRAMVVLADRLSRQCGATVIFGKIEPDFGHGAVEVGTQELHELLRDIGIEQAEELDVRVMVGRFPSRNILHMIQDVGADLILVNEGDAEIVRRFKDSFSPDTLIAAVRRTPPLRIDRQYGWVPQIGSADYADLFRDLRRGSRWGWDFVMMLSLASAIASLGLLQNSAAVVIGSMLLAPLMVPMIGFGLALAQANLRLGLTSARTIGFGTSLTLAVSFLIGLIIPGETLTPEALARGQPNVLDLLIALCSAVAATYAMARPSIVGAVAGVAIATALVPPLCTAGISIAYGDVLNAFGALVLFTTNLVAIMLASAQTFSFMGITASRVPQRQRRVARNGVVGLLVFALVLAGPLGYTLKLQIEQGRSQPYSFPVSNALWNAVEEKVSQEDGVEIMSLARPAVEVGFDVVLYLVSERRLPLSYRNEFINLIREVVGEEELRVHVILVRDGWEQDIWKGLEPPGTNDGVDTNGSGETDRSEHETQ